MQNVHDCHETTSGNQLLLLASALFDKYHDLSLSPKRPEQLVTFSYQRIQKQLYNLLREDSARA